VIDTIYIERQARNDAVTLAVLERLKPCRIIDIERFGEVFNPNTQNFRLQKRKPALILARKHSRKVLPTPSDYGIGGQHNYYFSHMMNCIYDCRYCFLQGMYSSSNYVVFTNYDQFFDDIIATSRQHPDEASWFFSGYDCDSLALEPVTEFMQQCLDLFESLCNQNDQSKRRHHWKKELMLCIGCNRLVGLLACGSIRLLLQKISSLCTAKCLIRCSVDSIVI